MKKILAGTTNILRSLVVQWLGYMTLTHEIRVQFPAREDAFFFLLFLRVFHTCFFFTLFPVQFVWPVYDLISRTKNQRGHWVC